ncbi:MAG: YbjN domain-containing protein [Sphingopyxis sp.]|nr:YbjN domain-containing protein [Sphingopyxis sp.]
MRPFRCIFAVAGVVAALSAAVPAQAEAIDARSPAKIEALVAAQGWETALTAEAGANPYIWAERSGFRFVIAFNNCDAGKKCRTLQFLLGVEGARSLSLDKINEWNRDQRFARAYRDDNGEPVLAMDLDLDFKGLPRENVDEAVRTWTGLIDSFYRFILAAGAAPK